MQGLTDLKEALAAAVMYLHTARETQWANRLKEVQGALESDPAVHSR